MSIFKKDFSFFRPVNCSTSFSKLLSSCKTSSHLSWGVFDGGGGEFSFGFWETFSLGWVFNGEAKSLWAFVFLVADDEESVILGGDSFLKKDGFGGVDSFTLSLFSFSFILEFLLDFVVWSLEDALEGIGWLAGGTFFWLTESGFISLIKRNHLIKRQNKILIINSIIRTRESKSIFLSHKSNKYINLPLN